jgi:hypothetical protein
VCFEKAATLFDFPRALAEVQASVPAFRNGRLRYYLDAMQLFEGHHQLALSLALSYSALHAIGTALPDTTATASAATAVSAATATADASLILWSNIFKYSLALYRFDEAYSAMTSLPTVATALGTAVAAAATAAPAATGPTPSGAATAVAAVSGKIETMRREWLRRLVVILSGCRQVRTLCRYEWLGMKKEVEEVLWWKARTSELWSATDAPPLSIDLALKPSQQSQVRISYH